MVHNLLISGKKIATDKYGYLIHTADWHEEIAITIAKQEELTLNEEHWHIIYFLRNFYQQYHETPPIRILVNQLMVRIGSDKVCSIYLNDLFPKGILKQASKLAGLPRPSRCM